MMLLFFAAGCADCKELNTCKTDILSESDLRNAASCNLTTRIVISAGLCTCFRFTCNELAEKEAAEKREADKAGKKRT
jgi:hypothetical protein